MGMTTQNQATTLYQVSIFPKISVPKKSVIEHHTSGSQPQSHANRKENETSLGSVPALKHLILLIRLNAG